MHIYVRSFTRLVIVSTCFGLLLCGCTVSATGPEVIGGNEQGGIVDGIGRGFGVEEMGIGSKKAFEIAAAHCAKYGKSPVVSPWTDGQMAFRCVASAAP